MEIRSRNDRHYAEISGYSARRFYCRSGGSNFHSDGKPAKTRGDVKIEKSEKEITDVENRDPGKLA